MGKGEDGMDVASSFEDHDEEGEGEDEEMPSKSKTKCALPPRAHAHGRANRAGHPRVEPTPAPPAGEAVLRGEANFMRMVEVLCACSFLPSPFLPAFTLTLTAFLQKEKLLTRFLF